jgi:hypothetical protein
MKPLPLPVRVAAGLAVTAVDRARHLPEKLAGLPVTMVSQALQLSMRVQQQVTDLAIKGDDALSTLRAPEESPAWATFDEDEQDQGSVRRSAFDAADPDGEPDIESDVVSDVEPGTEPEFEPGLEPDIEPGLGPDLATSDGASVAGDPWAAEERAMLHELDNTPSTESAIDAGLVEPRTSAAETAPSETPAAETTPAETAADAGAVELGETPAAEGSTPTAAGPTVLPDYGELTLAQVRARMRRLSIAELTELVDFERAHADRPSFVGMLNRRIATLRDQR